MSFLKQYKLWLAEAIAAYYLNCFFILKPILKLYGNYSTLILFGNLLVLLFLFFAFSTEYFDKRRVKIFILLSSAVLFSIIPDFFFRSNELILSYLYFFFIYGFIPAIFFLKVFNLKLFISFWTFFSLLAGMILLQDPFKGYEITGDYMTFGMGVLPAFVTSIIQLVVFRRKFFVIPAVFFFLEIFVFAHKGASLTAMVFFVMAILFFSNLSLVKKIFLWMVLLCLFIFHVQLIEMLVVVADKLKIGSYSLGGFNQMLVLGSGNEIYGVRLSIWEKALDELQNHYALGMGVGNFALEYNNYAHNFFLDILITYGVPFGMVVFFVVFLATKNLFLCSHNTSTFVFLLAIFALWFVSMMTSFTYWLVMPFWVFLYTGFYFGKNESSSCYMN